MFLIVCVHDNVPCGALRSQARGIFTDSSIRDRLLRNRVTSLRFRRCHQSLARRVRATTRVLTLAWMHCASTDARWVCPARAFSGVRGKKAVWQHGLDCYHGWHGVVYSVLTRRLLCVAWPRLWQERAQAERLVLVSLLCPRTALRRQKMKCLHITAPTQ